MQKRAPMRWAGLSFLCGLTCSRRWAELGHFGPKALFPFSSVLLISINVLILVKCITKCTKMLKM
jgi:hypothetical protein